MRQKSRVYIYLPVPSTRLKVDEKNHKADGRSIVKELGHVGPVTSGEGCHRDCTENRLKQLFSKIF